MLTLDPGFTLHPRFPNLMNVPVRKMKKICLAYGNCVLSCCILSTILSSLWDFNGIANFFSTILSCLPYCRPYGTLMELQIFSLLSCLRHSGGSRVSFLFYKYLAALQRQVRSFQFPASQLPCLHAPMPPIFYFSN